MIGAAFALIAAQAISIGQTGGITANRVDQVWNGTVPSMVGPIMPTVGISLECVVRRGMYVRGKDGRFYRTPRYRALSVAQRAAMLSACEVQL